MSKRCRTIDDRDRRSSLVRTPSSAVLLSVMSSTMPTTSGDGRLFSKEILKRPHTSELSRRK